MLAGLIDTLAGGGGLIALPALILAGIPPLSALGTNKLQGCMGTATATYLMFRNRRINYQECKPLMVSAFIGAVIGAIYQYRSAFFCYTYGAITHCCVLHHIAFDEKTKQ